MNNIFGSFDGETGILNGKPGFLPHDANIRVMFYGEIHNSDEIRKELENKGLKFEAGNDNELVAHAYKVWGEDFVKRLNGGFSLCIYDREKEIIVLARDHIGKKLLYYTQHNSKFIFSSRVKSIIETPGFPREVDLRALNFFITTRSVPGNLCIFKHIKKLPPGSLAKFDLKSTTMGLKTYWEPPAEEASGGDENELLEELEEILEDAVKLRMRGDFPLGAFLSGGLDSSLVVALMAKFSPDPVRTFCVGFEQEEYNELPFARLVAEYFGTNHSEFVIPCDFDAFLQSASIFDEPLGDPSIYPTYFAGKLAGENVKAVMSGDGADSLFLGMRSHYLAKRREEIKKYMVPPLDWISTKIAECLPEETKWRIFLEDTKPEELYSKRGTVFNNSLRKKLFTDRILDELGDNIDEPESKKSYENYTGTGIMTRLSFKSHQYSTEFKVETIYNHFSLQARTPFIDTRLVEFGFGKVPGNLKIKGTVTKYLLKELAKKYLPPEFPIHRKKGLNPPFSEWLRVEWNLEAKDILLSGKEKFFRKSYIVELFDKHSNPLFDQGRKLFNLLVFKIWERKYL